VAGSEISPAIRSEPFFDESKDPLIKSGETMASEVSANNNSNLWIHEKDWRVEIVMFCQGEDEEGRLMSLDYIGRLFAFAMYTDTRLVAQIGDPDGPAYELWFSFASKAQKQEFFKLVKNDAYADPDDDLSFMIPTELAMKDLADLKPLAEVFPEADIQRITAVGIITLAGLDN
jgi:hypothetical protein